MSTPTPTSTGTKTPVPVPVAATAQPPGHDARPGVTAARLVVALAVLVTVLFVALGLPAAKSGPREVPIGLAGPQQAVAGIGAALTAQDAGAFATTTYAGAEELRAAVRDREIYGGIVVGADGPQVLIASAGSPAVATTLTTVAAALGQQSGRTVAVEDVVPLPETDPRGAGLSAAALPLTMAGLLPAVLLSLAFPRRPRTAAVTAVAAAVAIGAAVTGALFWPFEAVETNALGVAGVLALGSAAISLTLLGLASLLGRPGLGLGAATMVLLGTPLSGLAGAPELLPAGWGALGQLLPPGATGQLLRSAAYFDGAASARPLTVLACWVAGGLLLLGLASLRTRRAAAAS